MRTICLFTFLLLSVALAGCAPKITELQCETLVKSTRSWDGDLLPAYPQGQPEITILKIQIPPHSELPMHYHPAINMGVLTKGKLTVIAESGKTLYLEQGDPIVELVDKLHYGKNETNKVAEIIVVYAAQEGEPITVKE